MNTADSERLASALEQMGLELSENANDADVVVLNSCVVRQSAEDKVIGNLGAVSRLKETGPRPGHRPDGLHGRAEDGPVGAPLSLR